MVLRTTRTTRAILVSLLIYITGVLALAITNHPDFIPVWSVAFDIGLVTGGLVAVYVGDGR
jgi:hypothetical protein